MSKNKSRIFLSFSIVMTIAVSAFLYFSSKQNDAIKKVDLTSLDSSLYDTNWLIGKSCEMGCWNGLTPGKTSRAETIALIKDLPFLKSTKFVEEESKLYFYCNPPMDEIGCGSLIFKDGLLEHIFLYLNYSISMDQAVEILGTPDGYSCFPADPGATGYELSIFYSKKQLILAYTESRKNLLTWRNNVCNQITLDGQLPIGYPVEDVHFIYPYMLDEMTGAQPWVGFSE